MSHNLRALIFDLDDTLYPEIAYVRSGFAEVAAFGQKNFNCDAKWTLDFLVATEKEQGRGAVFDVWLREVGRYSRLNVQRCVSVYRAHEPEIFLFPEAHALLAQKFAYPKFLVTDGNKIVQQRKIAALKIAPFFSKIFITHRYGVINAKPSLYCFEKIRQLQKCSWAQMLYVGDNPNKDFVSLNLVGMKTVRVLTGMYAEVATEKGMDAAVTIPDLKSLATVLEQIES